MEGAPGEGTGEAGAGGVVQGQPPVATLSETQETDRELREELRKVKDDYNMATGTGKAPGKHGIPQPPGPSPRDSAPFTQKNRWGIWARPFSASAWALLVLRAAPSPPSDGSSIYITAKHHQRHCRPVSLCHELLPGPYLDGTRAALLILTWQKEPRSFWHGFSLLTAVLLLRRYHLFLAKTAGDPGIPAPENQI